MMGDGEHRVQSILQHVSLVQLRPLVLNSLKVAFCLFVKIVLLTLILLFTLIVFIKLVVLFTLIVLFIWMVLFTLIVFFCILSVSE